MPAAARRRRHRRRRDGQPDGRDRQDRWRRSPAGHCWHGRWPRSSAGAPIERIVVVASPSRVASFGMPRGSRPRRRRLRGRAAPGVGRGRRRRVERHATSEEQVVLVHDGARPLGRSALVAAVIEATAVHGAAIPVVPVVETLKRIDGDVVVATVDRAGLGSPRRRRAPARDFPGRLRALSARWRSDLHRRGRAPRGLYNSRSCGARRSRQPQGDDRLRPPSSGGGPRSRLGPRVGFGEDIHPFGPGDAARARRHLDRRGAAARGAFGR